MKWGILGAGNIAHRFCKSLENINDCELYAVSCRTQEKAERFKEELHACIAYGGFEKLVNDPEVNAVYIAVPHQYHLEWILKCLRAHKAVLCEKPACMNADEIRRVKECAQENNTLFMEAMKTRFIPLYVKVKNMIDHGAIGEIQRMEVSLCNEMPLENMHTYHADPSSGGCLTDTGIYCASYLDDYLKDPLSLQHVYFNEKNGVNLYTRAELLSGNVPVIFECAFDRKKPRLTRIIGSIGTISIDDLHRPQYALYEHDGMDEDISIPYDHDDFYSQIMHFVSLYQQGKKESEIMPLDASVRCAEILDLIAKGMHYDEKALDLLKAEEESFHFSSFDVLYAGMVLSEFQRLYDRKAAIQIIREEDEAAVFQYIPASKSKRNLVFMEGKRRAALKCGHSSLYAYIAHEVHGEYQDMFDDMPHYCPAGGAYPVYVNGKWMYTILVSGLHEGEDHDLIIKALCKICKVERKAFPYKLV